MSKKRSEELLDALSLILSSQEIYTQNVKASERAKEVEQNALDRLQNYNRQLYEMFDEDQHFWYAESGGKTYHITKDDKEHRVKIAPIDVDKEGAQ